jgi:hypothetical protein
MKTLLEYTERMPVGLKMRTLHNIIKQHGNVRVLFEKHRNFGDAMNMSFTWRNTVEGHDFWETLSRNGIKETFKHYKSNFKSPKL